MALAELGRDADAEPWITESVEWALSIPATAPALARAAQRIPPVDFVQRAIDFHASWHRVEPGAGHDAAAEELEARRESW